MAYNGKRILNHIAYGMYQEEMDINCPERFARLKEERIAREINLCYAQRESEETARIAWETEQCWEEYERQENASEEEVFWADFYEFWFGDDGLEDEEDDDDELYVWAEILEKIQEEVIFIENIQQKNTRARRRKQEARHKRKMRRNAKSAMQNRKKRCREDSRNMTRCKRRGGRWVQMPKSLSMQAEELWKRAAKMKLVEAEYPG